MVIINTSSPNEKQNRKKFETNELRIIIENYYHHYHRQKKERKKSSSQKKNEKIFEYENDGRKWEKNSQITVANQTTRSQFLWFSYHH